MTTLRKVLAILAGFAAGYAVASLFLLTLTDVAVGVAVAAFFWLLNGCVRFVQKGRDKRYHPCAWDGASYG